MIFSSSAFFIFLFVVLFVYFVLNKFFSHIVGKSFLILASLFFYSYGNFNYVFLIIFSILFNYFLAMLLQDLEPSRKKKSILIMAIVVNIGFLIFYKYLYYVSYHISGLLNVNFPIYQYLLPIGISFYTFQQISFLVDAYKGANKDKDFIDYALFVSFFPQLIAGPLVTHNQIIPQFRDKKIAKFNPSLAILGLLVFSVGLSKKVLIADNISIFTEYFRTHPTQNGLDYLLYMYFEMFRLYNDFSGYSDMAIGTGLMFGVMLPKNFYSPLKKKNILEFWSFGWHLSLTNWIRNYIYEPVAYKFKRKYRFYIGIVIVYILVGLWHGPNLKFVLFGFSHAMAIYIYVFWRRLKKPLPAPIAIFVTFSFVSLAFILFTAGDIREVMYFYKHIFNFGSYDFTLNGRQFLELKQYFPVFAKYNIQSVFSIILFAVCVLLAFFIKNIYEIFDLDNYPNQKLKLKKTFLIILGICTACAVSIAISGREVSFIYYQF